MDDNTANLSDSPSYETSIHLDERGNEGVAPQHKEQEAPEQEQPAEKPKPESRQDAIKRAIDDVEAKAKAGEKPKDDLQEKELEKSEGKAEAKAEEKPDDKSEPVADKVAKPSEGRRIIEAPARLLPRAKELWNNVPHPVREEWERISKENDAEIAQYREAKQFRDELSEYEALGKQHGVSLKQALDNYVGIERKFQEDPAQGFKQLFSNLNMQPQQAITHILNAFGVSPQSLAAHINQDPNAYTALARPQVQQQQQYQQPAQQQVSPEISALKQQIEQMQADSVAEKVIAPFASEYPEYYNHETQIAKVLQSGIIEQIHGTGLSPRDKLEAALFMVAPYAAKANPVQESQPYEQTKPAVDLRGNPNKSVKGSPNPGLDNSARKGAKLSRQDAVRAALDELNIR